MSLSGGNASDDEFEQYDAYIDMFLPGDWETILRYYIIPVVVAFGIVGNIMTFIVIVSKLRNAVYVYLANLAIADTMSLIVGPFFDLKLISVPYTIYDIDGNNLNCELATGYFTSVAWHVAILTIFWLSIERYMAVCRPYWFQRSGFGTLSRSVKICAIVWIFCLSGNVVQFVIAYERVYVILPWPDMYRGVSNRETMCQFNEAYIEISTILWTTQFVLNILGNVIIAVLCFLMVYSLRKSQNVVKNSCKTNQGSKPERKIFCTVFVTVTVYVLCLTPLNVIIMCFLLDSIGTDLNWLVTVCRFGSLFNSSVNPLIYNVVNETFRQAFVDVFYRTMRRKLAARTVSV
ncbi:neuromedin-U receptor 2-like [Antedon mediterranea]|uniref:neuromedin-U receptor 2-like n=1 Tax=Antedon mediterranea TaxID=105859 RepID=UPI003AF7C280